MKNKNITVNYGIQFDLAYKSTAISKVKVRLIPAV